MIVGSGKDAVTESPSHASGTSGVQWDVASKPPVSGIRVPATSAPTAMSSVLPALPFLPS